MISSLFDRQAARMCNLARRAHGPAGRLFWEDVLPGEVGAGRIEDLVLHLQDPVLAPELGQLAPLVPGQSRVPSRTSAWAIHGRRQDSAIPRSRAISRT